MTVSTISTSKQRTSHLIRSRECRPCDKGAFPSGLFQDYFLSKDERIYDLSIDLNEVYLSLLSLNLNGIYTEYRYYSEVRKCLSSFGIKVKKRRKKKFVNELPGGIVFAGYWDYSDLVVELIFPTIEMFSIELNSDIWKIHSYELAKTVAHECIHVVQCSFDKEGDIYNYYEFEKPFGLKKTYYDEINYVYEPVEIEAMTFEAVLDYYNGGTSIRESPSMFQINRALSNFDKYSISPTHKKVMEKNINKSIIFWEKFLGIHGKNRNKY